MRALVSLLFSVLAAFGLSGCKPFAIESIKPGVTTAMEVRDLLGAPEMEWRNEDGSRTWEYSGQPEGTRCHMITIGPDQVVRAVEQVLNEKNFARIQAGMDADAVRRLLGKPASTQFFSLSQERVWNWHVEGMPASADRHFFTVHFDTDGQVLRTGRNVEYRN